MRTDLPRGTVTLLFTDVEGSTKLLHEVGTERYATLLGEHRRIVRDACAQRGGVEVDTQGDAFFFAFPTSSGALEAAQQIVDDLSSSQVRVRIGLHTGTPLPTGEGYVGPDVHRAARIAASGHGGQVLVSAATVASVTSDAAKHRVWALRDLGEHRFKDLVAAERIFQLGQKDFPAIRSLYRTNLPVPATSFLGRRRELEEVVEALRSPSVKLLTLIGPGGTGKTRLAIHAAAEASETYPDGIWWVALAPLRVARRLVTSLAQVLTIEEGPGIKVADAVAAQLDGKRALLVLDNAEHLLPAIATEIAKLRDIAGPTIVVTSRERLQVAGEHLYPVPPLAEEDGVELFLTRARALGIGVAKSRAVEDLCSRLDQLPLALELAAARTLVFSPEQLLERLSERLDLLRAGRDADPRQQTLRATIEWSHDLLDGAEQSLFRRFSVFAGSCTYEAAEVVCQTGPDTLQSLVDKSLLRRGEGMPPRFFMLETIRELAEEKLSAPGEIALVRKRHAEHYLSVARSSNLAVEAEGPQRHDLVIPERDNLRAALAWALENDERTFGLELVVGLENYWATSLPEEGLEWAGRLLDGASQVDGALVARALRVQGGMQNALGQLDASEQSWRDALDIVRPLNDHRAIGILLHRLSNTAMRRNDPRRARTLAEESLAQHKRSGGFPKGEAQALASLAWVARRNGDFPRALELLHESRAMCQAIGFRWWEAGMLANIGVVSAELGRLDDAGDTLRAALAISHPLHDRRGVVYELQLLADIYARKGKSRLAGTLLGAVEAESARAPVGRWIHEWDQPPPARETHDADFARGLEEGRGLDLDAAVAAACEARFT